jgi:hypothetical protein
LGSPFDTGGLPLGPAPETRRHCGQHLNLVQPNEWVETVVCRRAAVNPFMLPKDALKVFVRFEVAVSRLARLIGFQASPGVVWRWVQEAGRRAIEELEKCLEKAFDARKSASRSGPTLNDTEG